MNAIAFLLLKELRSETFPSSQREKWNDGKPTQKNTRKERKGNITQILQLALSKKVNVHPNLPAITFYTNGLKDKDSNWILQK